MERKNPDRVQLAFQCYIFYMDPNAVAELTAASFNINQWHERLSFKMKHAVQMGSFNPTKSTMLMSPSSFRDPPD